MSSGRWLVVYGSCLARASLWTGKSRNCRMIGWTPFLWRMRRSFRRLLREPASSCGNWCSIGTGTKQGTGIETSTGSDRPGARPGGRSGSGRRNLVSRRSPFARVIYRSPVAGSSTRRGWGATNPPLRGAGCAIITALRRGAEGPQSFSRPCQIIRSRQFRAIVRALGIRALGNLLSPHQTPRGFRP
jgi:hypothetical protein